MRLRNARMPIFPTTVCQPRVGPKPSTHCCLQLFVFFAANRGKSGRRDDMHSSRGEQEKSTVRTIYSVRIRKEGPCLTIEFHGDGFLYKMVRLIVGSLVKCALGKMRIEDVAARLDSGQMGPTRFAAPAEGLFLVRVRY